MINPERTYELIDYLRDAEKECGKDIVALLARVSNIIGQEHWMTADWSDTSVVEWLDDLYRAVGSISIKKIWLENNIAYFQKEQNE
jgi:hypothetical protein